MESGWIKLDRRILDWGWYKDTNTKVVFLHLLLTAYIEDREYRGKIVHRGECVTTIGEIAESVGISYEQARKALTHLKETNEITITRRSKNLEISITNYNKYQAKPNQNPIKTQSEPNHISKYINNINTKEKKERREEYISPKEDIDWETIEILRKCR